MTEAYRNHYVSMWYQRRFLRQGETRFHYLDLCPETVTSKGGKRYQRRALLRWGPKRCFCQDDLYTVKLGSWTTDEIERRFFGPIDARGQSAVEFFTGFTMRKGVHEAFNDLIPYMDAQRFRTPRGLDWLKTVTVLNNHNLALFAMQRVFQASATMWTEGIWEIVSARSSPTKFILADQPVTFFNPKAFPKSRDCRYPLDVGLEKLGTRTIFPLGLESCLIITHVQLVRDPWANPRRPRVNARAYVPTIMNFLDVQFGRELEEDEVIRINFILKKRASRYIAAAEVDWLFPEARVRPQHWSRLDEDWFLLPNLYKVKFSGGIVVGYKDGSSWAMDEYGRTPEHPDYQDRRLHDREWVRHLRARKEWAKKRAGRSIAHVYEKNEDRVSDKIMESDLEEYRMRRAGRSARGRSILPHHRPSPNRDSGWRRGSPDRAAIS